MNLNSVQDLKKHQQQQKSGKWNSSVGESSNLQSKFSYFVKLAPESPNNKSVELYHDESSYDSFHNWETDVCKDSEDDDFSDSGSSKTEGYAVLDLEYEVASTSDDETASSVSSGTDEFAIEAATNAFYEFNALVNGQLHDDDDDDDEFILADTEDDSDGSIDLELGQADYWKCVKCNNKQNNPLYRYCEKCYQVRKSLFPPRPKRQRKTRTENNRKRKMAQHNQDYTTSEIDSDSEFESPVKKKLVMSARNESTSPVPSLHSTSSCLILKNGNQSLLKDKMNNENSKHANSAGELSCNNSSSEEEEGDDEDEVDADGETSSLSFKNQKCDLIKKIKVSPSASIEISKVANYPSTSLIKVDSSREEEENEKADFLDFKLENKIIQNVYRQELQCTRRFSPPNSLDWKDSGMSSCQDSSQEYSSSPVDEGYLARTSSTSSTRSIDSQIESTASQASTQIQHDSDEETDSEGILTRVEEFAQERQEKMNQNSYVRPTDSQMSHSSQVSDDYTADINDSNLGICRFCMTNPKNGVFVHSNFFHLCCCYKCAVKVWKKRKSCPICNCKIKNVVKLFVH